MGLWVSLESLLSWRGRSSWTLTKPSAQAAQACVWDCECSESSHSIQPQSRPRAGGYWQGVWGEPGSCLTTTELLCRLCAPCFRLASQPGLPAAEGAAPSHPQMRVKWRVKEVLIVQDHQSRGFKLGLSDAFMNLNPKHAFHR